MQYSIPSWAIAKKVKAIVMVTNVLQLPTIHPRTRTGQSIQLVKVSRDVHKKGPQERYHEIVEMIRDIWNPYYER